MKKQILTAVLLGISVLTFAQKKEIKKAEKALASGNLTEAMQNVTAAEGLISASDNDEKANFYVVKGEVLLADAGKNDVTKLKNAAKSFLMAAELDSNNKFEQRLKAGKQNMRAALVNSAIEDQNAKKYKIAAEKLYTSYEIAKDTSDLYYAAGNAVNGQDYDMALKYYEQLLTLGYTGIAKEWIATDMESGEPVVFSSEADRSTNMLTGKYTNPDERMSESAKGDILRNVALIYISKGENENAMRVMKDARAANPDDVNLMRAEADIAYKMGNLPRYNELIMEVVASDPTNPELYYNLGVGSASTGDNDKAMEYYKKALELKPNYPAAQINVASLMLKQEVAIVDEMNALGNSSADNKKYEALKAKRKQLYVDVLPFLEAAIKERPDNVELVRTLMNIYSQTGNDSSFKQMKAKLAEIESKQ